MEEVMKQTLQGGMLGGSFSLVRTSVAGKIDITMASKFKPWENASCLWHWGATVLLGGHEPWLDPNGDWMPSQFLLLQPTSGTSLSWLLLYIADPKRTASTSLLPVRFAIGPATHRCEVWGGNHPWRLRGSLSKNKMHCLNSSAIQLECWQFRSVFSHVSLFFSESWDSTYNQLTN